MGEQTQAMLRKSLDALVQMDAALARDVCVCDDEVDQLKRKIRSQIEQQIRQDPEQIGSMLRLLSVSRNLERIADCAVNIAEDVIYMVDGRIVRHQSRLTEGYMRRRRLFWQLYPATLLIALVALVAVALDASFTLRRFYLARTAEDLQSRACLAEDQIAGLLAAKEICRDRRPLQGARPAQFHAIDGHPARRQGRGRLAGTAAGDGQPRRSGRGARRPGRGQKHGRLPSL